MATLPGWIEGSSIFSESSFENSTNESVTDRISWQPTLTFLWYAVITMLVGSLSVSAFVFLFKPELAVHAYGAMAFTVVSTLGAVLLWKKRYRATVIFLGSGVWLCITTISFFLEGLQTPIFYAHPLVVFFLGWVVSTRAAWIAALLTVLSSALFAAGAAQGWIRSPSPATPALHSIVQAFVLTLSAALVAYLVRAYRSRLEEMKAINREAERINDVLRQSELKFATAFASSPVAASIGTLAEGRIVELNQNFERDFGWSIRDFSMKTALSVGVWTSREHREAFVTTLKQHGRIVAFETIWRHKDGRIRKVSMSGEIIVLDGTPCILSFTTDITDRKAAEEQIQRLAFYDSLTNLPNRRLLLDRLSQAMATCTRHRTLGALFFLDLDNFKTLNDTHGHDKGDLLLKQVGRRLVDVVRDGDTVARLGGDEFVVMLEDLSHQPEEAALQAETVGRKLIAAMDDPYDIRPLRFHCTSSIGVTLFGSDHENVEEPIRRADMAMYQAKSAGRNVLRFYDPRMQAMVVERAVMERDLRLALQLRQFDLHYQPQVQRGGLVSGVEGLLRWSHPERGMVPPNSFITLAEEVGLIFPLGEMVLEVACTQLAKWANLPGMAHLTLSVNLSSRQFQQDDFVQQIVRVLERTGAPAQRLKLELTESLLINNVEDVIAKMDALKAHGVGFSLDDFGTGFSSLSYLKRLPLDQLKIDQSFVRDILVDPNDAAIARMVIVLAESLGLDVIAEGVETPQQQQALHALGCHAYQGYLFSRPLPLAALEQMTARPGWPVITAAA